MFDIVRASYGYTDEYILDKTLSWLYNSTDLIRRRNHDAQVMQAVQVAKVFSGKSKIEFWDDIQSGKGGGNVWIEDGEEDMDDLSDIGIGNK